MIATKGTEKAIASSQGRNHHVVVHHQPLYARVLLWAVAENARVLPPHDAGWKVRKKPWHQACCNLRHASFSRSSSAG